MLCIRIPSASIFEKGTLFVLQEPFERQKPRSVFAKPNLHDVQSSGGAGQDSRKFDGAPISSFQFCQKTREVIFCSDRYCSTMERGVREIALHDDGGDQWVILR